MSAHEMQGGDPKRREEQVRDPAENREYDNTIDTTPPLASVSDLIHRQGLLPVLCALRRLLNSPPIAEFLDESERAGETFQQQLLDEPQAAALLGIPAKTLGNLRRRGELPATTYVQRAKRRQVRYVRDALLLHFKIRLA